MANDDWVDGARRWYYGGTPPATDREQDDPDPVAVGYETAHPFLQAHCSPATTDTPNESPS